LVCQAYRTQAQIHQQSVLSSCYGVIGYLHWFDANQGDGTMSSEAPPAKEVLQAKIDAFQEALDWLENPKTTAIGKQQIQDELSRLRQQMFDAYGEGS
jgi:hypothetical protein